MGLSLQFSCFTAREKAMVINLEFIRAIVTADEVLLLEPLAHEVLPFVDKLRRHFPLKSLEVDVDARARRVDNQGGKHDEIGSECELPFEFQVLELALEAVCLSFNSSVDDLNRHTTFVLEDLTKNVSTKNLERVRNLKRNLTSLLAGVHKVSLQTHFVTSCSLHFFCSHQLFIVCKQMVFVCSTTNVHVAMKHLANF